MKIMQLGKSSAIPALNQFNVSYVIDCSGVKILIDTPPTIMQQLHHAHIIPKDIDTIFITHQHGDHLLGLPMLLLYGYIIYPDKIWKIIATEQIITNIYKLIHLVYPELIAQKSFFNDHIRFFPICDPKQFLTTISNSITLKTAPALHGVPCTAVRIESGECSIVYSADTDYSADIITLAHKADLLIHEATWGTDLSFTNKKNHSTVQKASKVARQAQCKRLWLTHLDNLSDNFITEAILSAHQNYTGKTQIVPDFKWLSIP